MMPIDTLALFAGTTAVLALTPGPNVALILSRTTTDGVRGGMRVLVGVEAAFVLHLASALGGLSVILLTIPAIFETLRWIGAAYLIYLAVQTIRRSRAAFRPVTLTSQDAKTTLIRDGFTSNALNPKTAIFYLAVFPQFLHSNVGSTLIQGAVLGAIHVITSTLCNLAIIFLAAGLTSRIQRSHSFSRLWRWLGATMLAAFAFKLIATSRPVLR